MSKKKYIFVIVILLMLSFTSSNAFGNSPGIGFVKDLSSDTLSANLVLSGIESCPDSVFTGLQLMVYYNSSSLILDTVILADSSIIAFWVTTYTVDSLRGKLTFVSATGTSPIAKSGVVFTALFKIKDTSSYDDSLTIDSAMVNETSIDDVNENLKKLPDQFQLKQNYPNPFNPTTTIEYYLSRKSDVTLSIYNQLGQIVKKVSFGKMTAGSYFYQWDGKDEYERKVSSGVYFYRLEVNERHLTKKMVLLK